MAVETSELTMHAVQPTGLPVAMAPPTASESSDTKKSSGRERISLRPSTRERS